MKKKQLRTFVIDDSKMTFNSDFFCYYFTKQASRKKVGICMYEEELATALYVDKAAIHNWRMGVNGPGDLEKIQLLANFWNIKFEMLLTEVKDMSINGSKTKLSDREKSALKNVYCSFLSYLDTFENTAGFVFIGGECRISEGMELGYTAYKQAKDILEREYIDLKNTLYDELDDFYKGDLFYTLQGCYSPEEGENPEQQQAIVTEMVVELKNKFKSIVDPYIIAVN